MNARTESLLARVAMRQALDAAELRTIILALDAHIAELQALNTELHTQLRELRQRDTITYTVVPTFETLHDGELTYVEDYHTQTYIFRRVQ